MDYHTAYTRTQNLKKFYRSIFIFAVIAVLIAPDDIFGEKIVRIQLFDRYTILGIWGLILLIKAIKLFVFDSEWEREMIERELEKEKKTIDY
ncbi:2TM domain-containing protein [Chryseobacterium sp. Tr-659]|uniref:2TM domain-containing protein n=1 Tax=Chryseobacterium sp. Tr-659 TaxID=2608340 RepID=UPI00141EFBCC|nr:2TM domain-containing protein [Chryseobacterium sp. Tr-659]NIF05798.1 2TM domain-containing protein [Chryseobacterium sp. Tr-659]